MLGICKIFQLFPENMRLLFAKRSLGELSVKAYRLVRREGFRGLYRVLFEELFGGVPYSAWVKEYDSIEPEDRKLIKFHISKFARIPRISVVMPVYNAPAELLRAAIESVRRQLYPNWELCIADDASTESHVRKILIEAEMSDPRIKVCYRTSNGHISAASNSALELATGEFIALLDHDDELAEHALYMISLAVLENPDLDLIYSDEDKIDAKSRRYDPYFKPDWNPDLFLGQNMISHLGVYRTSVVRSLGGFHEGLEGSQDWDLALRVVDSIKPERIHHVPHVLYHWRAVQGSTARDVGEKGYALHAARKALSDHFERKAVDAEVEPVAGGHFRIHYHLPDPAPLVSVIIPTRNAYDYLSCCLTGLQEHTDYPAMEIIVVDNDSNDSETLAYLDDLERSGRIRLLRYEGTFNYSAINNMAVRYSNGELICLLNNDIEPIGSDWLREMVSHAVRPGIGAVGAMLYYPDDTIQHAGIYLDGYLVGEFYKGRSRGIPGDINRARLAQDVSAVTAACLVVHRSRWDEVGGLDEDSLMVAFNDVDFCLKLIDRGYRNLWTPYAELYHYESATRGNDRTQKNRARAQREIECMRERWGDMLQRDPAVSPNRALSDPTQRLAVPPRVVMPWRRFESGV